MGRQKILTTEDLREARGATEFRSYDEAAKAIGQTRCVEVEEQADGYFAHPEIGEQLRLVGWLDCGNRLDFDDDLAVYDGVRAEALVQDGALVGDRDSDLLFKWQACLAQFEAKTSLVYGFEQSSPGIPVKLDRETDNPFSEVLLDQHQQTPVALRALARPPW